MKGKFVSSFVTEMEFSSSSSSGEEDESDDSGTDSSITSEQLMILRLDENVCPPQLDPALFNMAYELRNTRYNTNFSAYSNFPNFL